MLLSETCIFCFSAQRMGLYSSTIEQLSYYSTIEHSILTKLQKGNSGLGEKVHHILISQQVLA